MPMLQTLTLPQLVKENSQKWPAVPAMCMKRLGIWQRYAWGEYYQKMKHFSLGMIHLGMSPGDVVAIIGDNEPEWFWGRVRGAGRRRDRHRGFRGLRSL